VVTAGGPVEAAQRQAPGIMLHLQNYTISSFYLSLKKVTKQGKGIILTPASTALGTFVIGKPETFLDVDNDF